MKRENDAAPLISPLAAEALVLIYRLFAIERDINGRPAAERLVVHPEPFAPIAEMDTWMHATRASLSRHDAVAEAIAYFLND